MPVSRAWVGGVCGGGGVARLFLLIAKQNGLSADEAVL